MGIYIGVDRNVEVIGGPLIGRRGITTDVVEDKDDTGVHRCVFEVELSDGRYWIIDTQLKPFLPKRAKGK